MVQTVIPNEYSDLEKQRILEFRESCEDLGLSPYHQSDSQLIRWLRARDLDLPKAKLMLENHLQWRKENQADGILETDDLLPELKTLSNFANLGIDKKGHPALLICLGGQDTRAFLEKYGESTCTRMTIYNMELVQEILRKTSKEQGRDVTQVSQIVDLKGFSYRQVASKMARDFMLKTQTQMDNNYPEIVHHVLAINAPKLFAVIFRIFKPLIPKKTLEKLDIYGEEPERWGKVIAEKFDLNVVPPHWGGTRPGSDEYCSKDNIWVHGPMPLSFFTG